MLFALTGSLPLVRFSTCIAEEKAAAVLAKMAAGRACKPTLWETITSFDVAKGLSSCLFFCSVALFVLMGQLACKIDDTFFGRLQANAG